MSYQAVLIWPREVMFHGHDADPGFWIEENVLSTPECDVIVSALSEHVSGRGRAGARHLMANPIVATVANDHRLLSLAQSLLGSGAVPFRATLFEKSGKANWLVVWHQDTALPLVAHTESKEWGPWSHKAGILYAHAPGWALSRVVALRLHLDDSTKGNGPLRVIPGSHDDGVLSDEKVFRIARHSKYVECEVPKGGVLVMRPLLIHASSKARSDSSRRVLHIEYADSLTLNDGIQLAIA
ncbi:MAG TPA: phytanoyl-CoA dioxygenase family protein [Pyrinomonadaceae bacterium]|nr:phytanoyl-CoA dioxygenase family protein [Pyrinomonadaceae bacterium]